MQIFKYTFTCIAYCIVSILVKLLRLTNNRMQYENIVTKLLVIYPHTFTLVTGCATKCY